MKRLFMILVGCKPKGRNTEQHDVFFGIAENLKELVPAINAFWPEAEGKIHIDAWRAVVALETGIVNVVSRDFPSHLLKSDQKLFFVNLGGYKKDVFEEFHYKMLIVGTDAADAVAQAKASLFYEHTGFKGAPSHIDDKYGLDTDDVYPIEELLSKETLEKYQIIIHEDSSADPDEINLGYLKLSKIK